MRLPRGFRGLRLSLWLAPVLGGPTGCGDTRRTVPQDDVEALVRQLVPAVEKAVGLSFRRPPTVAVRGKDQVRAYLQHKLDSDFPPEEIAGVTAAYRLFGLIPDTLDLRSLLLALFTEQVVGYYDPDSTTLYVVEGTDPAQLRLVLAHELVHGLQGQYVALDSLLSQPRANDRRMAAQAVMEGQATLASLTALMPEQDYSSMPHFWEEFRRSVRAQQDRLPVFGTAPAVIREGLIFPYLAGADFVRWFNREYPDTVPFGPRLPQSTEQILHPERYREGDVPAVLWPDPDLDATYQDGLGEFETRVLLTHLTGSESVGAAGALGWDGDRYAVMRSPHGYALVWWSVWDTEKAADRVALLLDRNWPRRPGRRAAIERTPDGNGVRLIDAPEKWAGWKAALLVNVKPR
jgi:hypothetical protein